MLMPPSAITQQLKAWGFSPEQIPTAAQWQALWAQLHQFNQTEQWETAVQALGEGLCLLDQHGRVQFANPEAYLLLDYPPAQLNNVGLLDLIDVPVAESYPNSRTLLIHLVGTGLSFRQDSGQMRQQSATLFPASYTITPILNGDSHIDGAVLVFRDTSDRRQMEAKLKQQIRDTVLLNRVISTTTSASDIVTILRILSTELAHALNVPQAACALLNEAQTQLTVVAEYRTEERTSALGTIIPVKNNPGTQYIMRTRRPLVSKDVQNDERIATRDVSRERGTVSMMLLPLFTRERIIGTMGLNSPEPREFTPEEITLAQNVAAAASQALENAELYERLQAELSERRRQNEYLAALYQTTLGLLERMDTNTLLETIVTRAGALAGTEHGVLYVAEGSDITMQAGTGIYRPHIGAKLRADEGLSGKVWRTGEMLAVRDYQATFGYPSRFGQMFAAVSVPLRSGPIVTGVIGLARVVPDRPFSSEELNILERFAQLASLVLDNALLYSALQQELVEREATQKKLQAAKVAAEEANRVKSSFLASMSHELRTPLNAIIGYSDLLAEDIEEQALDELLPDIQRIQKAGGQLLTIISDILDISKIEAGQSDLSVESFHMADMLAMLESIYTVHFQERGNSLVVTYPDDLGQAHTDYHKVQQILTNLLGNANKFTNHGRVTLSARRVLLDNQPWYFFTVQDTGIGIPTDMLDTIFDPFRQADESMSRRYGGTGLGLAICRRFCDILGGTIEVDSEVNEGSIFTVRLPAILPS
jgi:signal transduction histidine kinase